MKAMILAAGKGERMLPLTSTLPKPLINVRGQPLIAHHLNSLAKIGVTDVVINTFHLGQRIIEVIGDGAKFDLNIHYSIEDQLLDTGGGIVKALPLLGSDPFILLSSDILTDFSLQTLPSAPLGLAHLVLVDNPYYKQTGDFALDKGLVKLANHNTFTYANIGVYRPEFFVAAPQGPFALGGLLRQHIANELITGQYFAGQWHNIGTPQDLELVNSTV